MAEDPTKLRPYGAGYRQGTVFGFRATKEQAAEIDSAVKTLGVARSTWIRDVVLAAARKTNAK